MGLGFAAVLGGVAGLYRLVRPRFKYRVNCHFCCQDSMVRIALNPVMILDKKPTIIRL